MDLPRRADGYLLDIETARVDDGGDGCDTACEGSTNVGAVVVHETQTMTRDMASVNEKMHK